MEDYMEKLRLKGIKLAFTATYMKHSDFFHAVTENTEDYEVEFAVFSDIISKNHQIQTVRRSKKTLTPFNDKKCFITNRLSYSHGHRNIIKGT